MEQNKFEQQLKEKLEGRVIEPSAKSWDRLDAMLSVEEKPKKKSFLLYYVAASLFFAFGISFWFVNRDPNEVIPQNTIVTTEGEDSLESFEEQNSIENKVETNDNLIEDIQINQNLVIVQNNVVKDSKREDKNVKILQESEVIALNENEEIQIRENNKLTYVSPEKLLASVENNQGSITIANSSATKKTVNVNANSLLSSVENEIKEEYRETTFDKLKRKFNETKSAVANRNYE